MDQRRSFRSEHAVRFYRPMSLLSASSQSRKGLLFTQRFLATKTGKAAMQPDTRYAKSGDVHIAYQVFGEGPDLVLSPGFVSHIENYWDEPGLARWLNRL